MQPTIKSVCEEIQWLLQQENVSFQSVIRRVEILCSLWADAPVGIVSDEKSLRLWVLVGKIKAWHVLQTPIKLGGPWTYQRDSDNVRRAWKDLSYVIEKFTERDDTPISWPALYELCVGRMNRVGRQVAGSDTTVRGWKDAKGWPKEMTWQNVRKWLNTKKDYDIGEPPTEC